MKDLDKVYAEHIAEQYAPKTESKVVQLKKLDQKVKRPAKIFGLTFGIVFTLIFGTGMCLAMGQIGGSEPIYKVIGIIVGLIGIAGVCINYPIYNKILKSRKEKYASDIITLAKSISE